ncbi:hypothetical protein AALP_AA8G253700 [Arabis alpina]|uniref:Uncharacterized protein n=1 Tax=Arabis alpina TaxID=50452 RepID=A0A087G9C1_ARAAL|nr:hypothetical protein AALP_AA8G253700 [Arabis alpina]
MEHPRSFRSLVPRTTGSGKPPMPTTTTTSAAPTVVPAPAEPTTAPASATPTTAPTSAKLTTMPTYGRPTTVPSSGPRDTSSAKKTTTIAKGSRLPSVARTEVVAALPALPAPLPPNYDAKRAAKGKGHEGDDRKRSSDRDNDKASASCLFSTLLFHDDVVAPINTESSGDMMRQGLKFLGLVNKVGHEVEAKVEVLKEKLEHEMHHTENARTAAEGLRDEAWKSAEALLTEAERSAIALAAAEEREQCSAAIMMKRDGKLDAVVEKLRKADGHIQSLERNFARARDKFDELQGDPRSNMVYQVQRVANLDFVRLLLGLLDGQEPPKLEDELAFLTADIAEHAEDEGRFEQLMTSLHGLLHVLDPKVKAPTVVAHDRTLETYAASVGVADPSGSLLGGAGSRKAAIVGVDGKFSLIGGVGAEVTKSRIEDVAEDAGTVGAPEEMRMDEDSQGPRIRDLTTSLERQRLRGCR